MNRFEAHDKFQEDMMKMIRPFLSNGHVPDIRIMVNGVILSIDFKTTRNVEKNSHDTYFGLHQLGELVGIVYNNRPYEAADNGVILADWIDKLTWSGPIPPSIKSRSGDPYYRISGGLPLTEFLKSIK
jgi:hypothetical protein